MKQWVSQHHYHRRLNALTHIILSQTSDHWSPHCTERNHHHPVVEGVMSLSYTYQGRRGCEDVLHAFEALNLLGFIWSLFMYQREMTLRFSVCLVLRRTVNKVDFDYMQFTKSNNNYLNNSAQLSGFSKFNTNPIFNCSLK